MDFLTAVQAVTGKNNAVANEPMAKHTTFRAGGAARYAAFVSGASEIEALIKLCHDDNVQYYIVGNGSNLLVSDKGYDGLMIIIGRNMSDISIDGNIIRAGAGALLSAIGSRALAAGLTGFEFACGIPGTLGGACFMNAGAYGGEMKDVLVSVDAVTPDGSVRTFYTDEMQLGYRTSMFAAGGYVITGAVIELHNGERDAIKARMDELAGMRRLKQPLEYPSAGSTFKRPEGMFAGQLIEESGLKGRGVGDACVSEKHAGFVINKGSATATDIYDTIQFVISEVHRNKGVILEPEVRIIGEF